MGVLNERHPEHEGWPVALHRDEKAGVPHNDYYRELAYPADKADGLRIDAVQMGCDCGWRSERVKVFLPSEAQWLPFTPLLSQAMERRLEAFWREHIATLDARVALPVRAVS